MLPPSIKNDIIPHISLWAHPIVKNFGTTTKCSSLPHPKIIQKIYLVNHFVLRELPKTIVLPKNVLSWSCQNCYDIKQCILATMCKYLLLCLVNIIKLFNFHISCWQVKEVPTCQSKQHLDFVCKSYTKIMKAFLVDVPKSFLQYMYILILEMYKK